MKDFLVERNGLELVMPHDNDGCIHGFHDRKRCAIRSMNGVGGFVFHHDRADIRDLLNTKIEKIPRGDIFEKRANAR